MWTICIWMIGLFTWYGTDTKEGEWTWFPVQLQTALPSQMLTKCLFTLGSIITFGFEVKCMINHPFEWCYFWFLESVPLGFIIVFVIFFFVAGCIISVVQTVKKMDEQTKKRRKGNTPTQLELFKPGEVGNYNTSAPTSMNFVE